MLQVLQRGFPRGRRWVLKSPAHLHTLPDLLRTYPDARIAVTHRDPITVLGSVSSLIATLRWVHSDDVDFAAIGKYHEDLYAGDLDRLVDFRRERAEHRGSCAGSTPTSCARPSTPSGRCTRALGMALAPAAEEPDAHLSGGAAQGQARRAQLFVRRPRPRPGSCRRPVRPPPHAFRRAARRAGRPYAGRQGRREWRTHLTERPDHDAWGVLRRAARRADRILADDPRPRPRTAPRASAAGAAGGVLADLGWGMRIRGIRGSCGRTTCSRSGAGRTSTTCTSMRGSTRRAPTGSAGTCTPARSS
ncbi:sulfotransferase [Yinghuangia aomiensis]